MSEKTGGGLGVGFLEKFWHFFLLPCLIGGFVLFSILLGGFLPVYFLYGLDDPMKGMGAMGILLISGPFTLAAILSDIVLRASSQKGWDEYMKIALFLGAPLIVTLPFTFLSANIFYYVGVTLEYRKAVGCLILQSIVAGMISVCLAFLL